MRLPLCLWSASGQYHPASYPWPMSRIDRSGLVQGDSDARQSCPCTTLVWGTARLCCCNTHSCIVCFTERAALPGAKHTAAAAQELRTRPRTDVHSRCGRVRCLRARVSHQLRHLRRRALAHRQRSTGAPARSDSCHARARSSPPPGCSSPAGCGAARATQCTIHAHAMPRLQCCATHTRLRLPRHCGPVP